jgi:hypothetical protein
MRFLGAVLLLGLLPGSLDAFLAGGSALIHSRCLWPFAAGFAVGLVVEQLLLSRLPGLDTFEHELTHVIAAWLFLRRVTGFKATWRRGGHMSHTSGFGGGLGDDFIGMAPYVLPTFTLLLVIPRPLLPTPFLPWYDATVGFTFSCHLLSNIRETRSQWHRGWFRSAGSGEYVQTDLGRRGLAFSFIYVVVVSLAIHGLLAALMGRGFQGLALWARHFWQTEVVAWSWVAEWTTQLLRCR